MPTDAMCLRPSVPVERQQVAPSSKKKGVGGRVECAAPPTPQPICTNFDQRRIAE